jgi:hypothetical protein
MAKFEPGGIRIFGTDDYEDDVKEQLNVVLKNPVGKVLLGFIDANPNYIRIVPQTKEHSRDEAVPDNQRDASPEGVIPFMGHGDSGHIDATGRVVTTSRNDKFDWKGTGEGTDDHIYYEPSARTNGAYGSKADEVLCHELVHAYRDMRGLSNPVPTSGHVLWYYLNEEEWLAILITNIYISAKNSHKNELRADHQANTELKAPLNSSVGFLNNQDHRRLVQKYWLQEMRLYFSLANVFAPYNPIYEFVNNLAKYNQP